MRKILTFIALLVPLCSIADQPIQTQAATFDKWIPSGWKVIRITHGDLANHGKDDVVIILEKDDPKNYKKNDKGLGAEKLNLNPRRMIVLMDKQDDYEKIVDTDHFIPSENSEKQPCLQDPLEDGNISISSKHILNVELHYFSTCGGWSTSIKTWKFRYEYNRLHLIGLDEFIHIRSSGDESKISANFLTGKIEYTSTMSSDNYKKSNITHRDIQGRKLFYMDEISANLCKSDKIFTDLCP